MLPELVLISTLALDILVVIFIVYYFFSIRNREKRIETKENNIDSNYHHVVDEALSKERKILDDATNEADQIISGAKYLTKAQQDEINNTIKALIIKIQKEGDEIAKSFTSQYSQSLSNMSSESLSEFQKIMLSLQSDLQNQIKSFHETLLPEIEKELQVYKQTRLNEIEQTVTGIIQKASQDIFNKSLSMNDHQNIIKESLEKAKKEGVFD